MLADRAGKRIRKPIKTVFVKSDREVLKLLETGKVDFALLSPETYVEEVGLKIGLATLAVLAPGREYGFQVALMVRPDSGFEMETDVLYSEGNIGVLQMPGDLKARFYYGPLTDEDMRMPKEFRERRVFAPNAKSLVDRLKKRIGKRKISAALIPLRALGPLEDENMRSGLKELWLSPLYPGPVIAARLPLSKLQRTEFSNALITVGDSFEHLTGLGIGGFKPATDEAFEPLREFVREQKK